MSERSLSLNGVREGETIDLSMVETGRAEAVRDQMYGRRTEELPTPTPLPYGWLEMQSKAREFYDPNEEPRQEP